MLRARDVDRLLHLHRIPRADRRSDGSWTYGYGVSARHDGTLIVWCNPGGDSDEAWERGLRLRRRVEQTLTLERYPTSRSASVDPPRVFVTGDRRPRTLAARRALLGSRLAAFAVLVLSGMKIAGYGDGTVLLALICVAVAVALGARHDRLLSGHTPAIEGDRP